MVSIYIPDLFPPDQTALIHIITIKECALSLSLSLSLSQKQTNIKARENCLPKKESVEPEIVLPTQGRTLNGGANQGRLWNRGALCIPLEPPLTPLGAESTKTIHKL
ncbi:hypothetical protein DPMN_062782 [Dreissena polymorpha]|uniref:Uncharacterized protein n=1 Tax=Dreissena polymorpha TaxID=45954 RepID=A0A9D4HJM7_DREPO|nr:hypothetical protein DPMN_062782 [Dreissena polymorpha]